MYTSGKRSGQSTGAASVDVSLPQLFSSPCLGWRCCRLGLAQSLRAQYLRKWHIRFFHRILPWSCMCTSMSFHYVSSAQFKALLSSHFVCTSLRFCRSLAASRFHIQSGSPFPCVRFPRCRDFWIQYFKIYNAWIFLISFLQIPSFAEDNHTSHTSHTSQLGAI